MKPKTELFLYQLAWTAGAVMRPTFRNLNESFEGWCYREGLLRQVATLEREALIEVSGDGLNRVCRLTERGRLHALGGLNPVERWERSWDGMWRMVLFDLPETKRALRNRLRKLLRERRLGCLQQSVWISPDPTDSLVEAVRGTVDVPDVLVFMEGRTCAGEEAARLAGSAWDFAAINERWLAYERHLNALPTNRSADLAAELKAWSVVERQRWLQCRRADPFLPEALLPSSYRGREVWELRSRTLAKASKRAKDAMTKL